MTTIIFRIFYATAITFFLGCSHFKNKEPRLKPIPIMQGFTTDQSTQLIVLIHQQDIEIVAPWAKPPNVNLTTEVITWPNSDWRILQINIEGLDPETIYQIQFKTRKGQLIDERQFRALSKSTTRENLKIAVTSCMDDSAQEQSQIWRELVAHRPQMIWMIGDNVYADWRAGKNLGLPDPLTVWERFAETRSELEIFKQRELTPIFSVWDDHDYGMNDGDRTHPYKREAFEIYQAFFGRLSLQQPEKLYRGPGLSFAKSFGDHRFIFLDGRSFRSPNQAPSICKSHPGHFACKRLLSYQTKEGAKDETVTHLGDEQMQWLLKQLKQSVQLNQLAWLIKGDQFFGGYQPFESWQGNHPKDFKVFLQKVRALNPRILLISGDRHISEVMQLPQSYLGRKTFEITSSPIHARVFPSDRDVFPNPLAIEYVSENHNFIIITAPSRLNKSKDNFKIEAFGRGQEQFFSRQIELN